MESVTWQTRVAEDLLDLSRQYTYDYEVQLFSSQWVAKY